MAPTPEKQSCDALWRKQGSLSFAVKHSALGWRGLPRDRTQVRAAETGEKRRAGKHRPAPGEVACSFYSCVSGPAWASSLGFLPPDFPSDVLGHPRLLVQSSPRTPMIHGDGSSPHLQTHLHHDPLSRTDLSIKYCGCSYRKIYFQSLFFYI